MTDGGGCAALSAAAGEPLAGTASRIRHWLMVEQPGRWEHDALLEGGLPRAVGEHLRREGDRLGVRVLLIRRRDRPRPDRRRCFAAFTGRRERRLAMFEIEDPRELLELDLEALTEARWAHFGERTTGPVVLICTHGKRDPDCSRFGGPPARALAARPDAWECTHIGGDRFAGNLVCFPHGLYFGRVDADAAMLVAGEYETGRIALEYYRGRSAYPSSVQAAERELRLALDLVGVDDLVLEGHGERSAGEHDVVFRIPGGEERKVSVREVALDARLLTCKASGPSPSRAFELDGIS
ncbi:MAG: sucrase ferredoxin [Actinomycetota bacterium]